MLRHIFIIPFTLLKFLYLVFVGIVKKLTPYALSWKKSVADKIVVITGAGSGIGRETAIRFAHEGATLVLWDVDAAGNSKTAKLVRECGVKAFTYTCDVTKSEEVYRVAKRVKEEVGKVFILVNNAGIVAGKPFLDLKDEEIRKTMEVNTMAHFWVSNVRSKSFHSKCKLSFIFRHFVDVPDNNQSFFTEEIQLPHFINIVLFRCFY